MAELGGRLDMQQARVAFEGDFSGVEDLEWIEIVDLTADVELPTGSGCPCA